jgi:hypothetical protein
MKNSKRLLFGGGLVTAESWGSGFGRWGEAFLAGITAAPRLLRDDVPHHLGQLLDGIESYDDLPPFEASPSDPDMKDQLNHIKDREEFRPVAPAVLEQRAGEYFTPLVPDPFMLFVSDVRPEKADEIPAVRHVDGTARIQTVSREHAPAFHALISAFERRTGVPVVVNTSFNSLGRPIMCTPEDALECYFTTPLDALAIGPYLLKKAGCDG